MAYTILGQNSTPVQNGAYGNKQVPSSFGLPGQFLPPAFCRCDFTVRIVIFDNLRCYVGIDGGSISQGNVYGTNFPCFLAVRPQAFVAQPNDRTGQIAAQTINKVQNPGPFAWNFNAIGTVPNPPASVATVAQLDAYMSARGLGYVGLLPTFSWVPNTNDGYLYIGGTATYYVTDPVYPQAIQIIMPAIKQYLDYFPGAITKSNVLQSSNRPGGHTQIRKNGVWRDCKNSEDPTSSRNTVFIRKSGAWRRCIKMGSGASIVALISDLTFIDFGQNEYPPSPVDPITVTISSATAATTGIISLSLTDTTGKFALSKTSLPSMSTAGASNTFDVSVSTGGNPGTYTATVSIKAANSPDILSIPIQYETKHEGPLIDAPFPATITADSVTLQTIPGTPTVVYSRSEVNEVISNNQWQSSTLFDGLVSGDYNFYAATSATDEYYMGPISGPTKVTV